MTTSAGKMETIAFAATAGPILLREAQVRIESMEVLTARARSRATAELIQRF
ncbi:MAG: hypothetical protein WD276_07390 [Actinomycetota bacterium]